jgi:ribonuclease R
LLKGERTGAQFRLGDHVRIQVLRASLEDRKIDFRLVSPRTPATPPGASGKAYDYAASGERYSLPKKAPVAAKPAGLFGRATKAIGRAFGRKQAEPVVPAPTPAPAPVSRKTAASHHSPSRAAAGKPPVGKQPTGKQPEGKRGTARKAKESSSSNNPRKEESRQRGAAPAAASAPKKHSRRRRPKPKGES